MVSTSPKHCPPALIGISAHIGPWPGPARAAEAEPLPMCSGDGLCRLAPLPMAPMALIAPMTLGPQRLGPGSAGPWWPVPRQGQIRWRRRYGIPRPVCDHQRNDGTGGISISRWPAKPAIRAKPRGDGRLIRTCNPNRRGGSYSQPTPETQKHATYKYQNRSILTMRSSAPKP
jgi:hypothetical protein